MRVTFDGRVTIPRRIRRRKGMSAGTRITVVERDGRSFARAGRRRSRQSEDDFAVYLARVTGIVDLGMSADEFMEQLRGE